MSRKVAMFSVKRPIHALIQGIELYLNLESFLLLTNKVRIMRSFIMLELSFEIQSSLIDNIHNYIVLIDRNYKIVFVNHPRSSLKKESFIGRDCIKGVDGVKEQDRLGNIFRNVFTTGITICTETRLRVENIDIFDWYDVCISALKIDNEPIKYLILASTNINKRKHIEEENEKLKKQVDKLVIKQASKIKAQKIATNRKNLALLKLMKNVACHHVFTKREKEILTLVEAGFLSKEIAGQLHISTKTVSNHRENINKKIAMLDLEED